LSGISFSTFLVPQKSELAGIKVPCSTERGCTLVGFMNQSQRGHMLNYSELIIEMLSMPATTGK